MLLVTKNVQGNASTSILRFDRKYADPIPAYIWLSVTNEATQKVTNFAAMTNTGTSRYLQISLFGGDTDFCVQGVTQVNMIPMDEGLYTYRAYSATQFCVTAGGTLITEGLLYIQSNTGAFVNPEDIYHTATSDIIQYES